MFHTDERLTVHFEDVTVACYSGRDFIQIMNATGVIDPLTLEWIGSQGTVTWERVGMPDTEMYARLGSYSINLKTPSYTADSVVLYYPALFQEEVLGKLEDKVTLIKNLQSAQYPRFASYKNSYSLRSFYREYTTREDYPLKGQTWLDQAPCVSLLYWKSSAMIHCGSEQNRNGLE